MSFIRRLLSIGFAATLGWTLGGPIGAIIGVVLESIFDKKNSLSQADDDSSWTGSDSTGQGGGWGYGGYTGSGYSGSKSKTTIGDFDMSIIVLSAAIMKVDGVVMRSELNYVKRFFVKQFGEEAATANIKILQGVLKQDINIYDVCRQINRNMNKPSKRLLLQYLFGVANADNSIAASELDLLQLIAQYIGLSTADFESIKAMFVVKETVDYYSVLGITRDATDEEVRKAYKSMAVKHHPDKVSYLGEEAQKAAQEKFIKIQEAYEQIKLERGMK
ncbi:MAG: TerB family tellurite resistance protein [Bacteroidales bacterium]|nr:TerB family tellurite resistance protein [Bacteroidales bacterium]